MIRRLAEAFEKIPHTYIADGHHRAASAVEVSMMRRREHPDYTGEEEFNYFLSVLFPDEELRILDYNRVLKDLNGYSREELLEKLRGILCPGGPLCGGRCAPSGRGEMGLYLGEQWYRPYRPGGGKSCRILWAAWYVAFLQREVLEPVFGIRDPKTDRRIDFVGGIPGAEGAGASLP